MSARTEPCSEFVILTTTLSLSYALRILFLYRVLYVFKGLAPTCGTVSFGSVYVKSDEPLKVEIRSRND